MSEEENNYVEGTNMTEQEFVDGYVEKAANESLEAADNWVEETLGGQPTQDMMTRLGPLVLAKMKDQGLIPDDSALQEQAENNGLYEDDSAADSEDPSESSTEATQEPEEAYGQPAEGTQEEASESNTEATEDTPEVQED